MDHWPDIGRCMRLKDNGFSQLDRMFCCAKHPSGRISVESVYGLGEYSEPICAAPIVTELVEEIKKLNPPKREDEAWIDIDIMADGMVYAGIPALLDEHDYRMADTVANVLTDLWLWLRGREK